MKRELTIEEIDIILKDPEAAFKAACQEYTLFFAKYAKDHGFIKKANLFIRDQAVELGIEADKIFEEVATTPGAEIIPQATRADLIIKCLTTISIRENAYKLGLIDIHPDHFERLLDIIRNAFLDGRAKMIKDRAGIKE